MSGLKYSKCPICGAELESGSISFPVPHSPLADRGRYCSDKKREEYKGNPVRWFLASKYDREFGMSFRGFSQPAGYCGSCERIFTDFAEEVPFCPADGENEHNTENNEKTED